MKKIVIIDDEYFFRQALIKYVRSFKDEFTVVGDVSSGNYFDRHQYATDDRL